jgi:Ca-activated chloride channel homolog
MRHAPLTALLAVSLLVSCGRASEPKGPRTDVLSLDAVAANRFVRAGVPSQVTAEISVGVKPLDRSGRPAANLALVVDTSGSMEGKAMEDARSAALALVDSLSPKDRLSIIVFNSRAELLLPSTLLDDADLKDVRGKLRAMRAEGTTDMASGLAMGVREVSAHIDPEAVNRVILLGDGVPNDESQIAQLTANAGQSGISITALGLGPDYNESLMGRMAQVTGGRFQYVADSSKVPSFFKEEVARLQKTYARDAWLELAAGPGVTIDDVVGQEVERSGNSVRVHVGDLALGEHMDVVVKLSTAGRKDGAAVELLDAVLRFNEGVGGARSERRVFLGTHATGDDAKLATGKNVEVERAASRAKEAADTLEAIRQARASDVKAPVTPPAQSYRGGGAPSPSPSPAAAVDHAAFDREAPAVVRKRHDDAMQVLQKH